MYQVNCLFILGADVQVGSVEAGRQATRQLVAIEFDFQ